MKRFSILMVLIFVLVSCGEAIEKEEIIETSSVEIKTQEVKEEKVVLTQNGYETYSQEAIKTAEGKIVLFFHADWCATCKRIQEDIFANTIPEGITILEVNYDEELELKKKYGVNKTSTLVEVDNQGNMIQTFKANTLSEIVGSLQSKEAVDEENNVVESQISDVTVKDSDKVDEQEEIIGGEEVVMKNKKIVESAGSYQDFSDEAVNAATGKKVLFFAAAWCPSCVAADKKLSAETVPEGLNVFKVDYDSSIELRQKYGVTSQHTFVLVDENMDKVKLMVGGTSSDDIVKNLLN